MFRVDLPLELAPPPSPSRQAARARVVGLLHDGSAPRILIADDDPDSRTWLRTLIEQIGFEVREAVNGLDVLSVVDLWLPRLALIDMHMPGLDGLGTVRALRSRSAGDVLAIIVITASAFDDTRDAVFAAGADGWLRKPCREHQLLQEIARLIGIEYRYATLHPRSRTPSLGVPAVGSGALEGLSLDLARRLRDAARVADYYRLSALVEEAETEHPNVADELRTLVERYAYDEIERRVGTDVGGSRPAERL